MIIHYNYPRNVSYDSVEYYFILNIYYNHLVNTIIFTNYTNYVILINNITGCYTIINNII